MEIIFFKSFFVVALVYAIIAATTTIFYKNKAIMDLNNFESNVVFGRATLGDRVFLFGSNLLASVFAPPVYILAILITIIITGSFSGILIIMTFITLIFLGFGNLGNSKNIGKLKKVAFVDIKNLDNEYKYDYLLYSKKFFKTLYFKLFFISKLPYYTFSDITKVLKNEGFFFEDIISREIPLSIGTVSVKQFSQSDYEQYSNNYKSWMDNHFDIAMKKQESFQKEYENKFGYPDDLGLHKAWDS